MSSPGKLSALAIKRLGPGRYGDGGGLWLQVRNEKHRSWLFRYTPHTGQDRWMGLGSAFDVSLADAREAARVYRNAVREGRDPIDERRQAKHARRSAAQAVTFAGAADRYLAAHSATWRNEKHRWQWRQTLDVACRQIGSRPVQDVTTHDVMQVLEPIWHDKPETASRLRGRIESVIDYAAAHGWRSGDNPARWRGHLAKLLPAPNRIARVQHHPALPWREIGTFMDELRHQEGVSALALRFTILTAARTGEAIGARWREIDFRTWAVPGDRMKAGKEHRVPLSEPVMDLLEQTAVFGTNPDAFVFPGKTPGMPLSNMAMTMLLRRMGRPDLTVHGFRSTFRDWCAEATNYPREVAEAALAHVITNQVEAAYRRSDLFEKRRRLMDDWAAFCSRPAIAGEVVPLRRQQSGGQLSP